LHVRLSTRDVQGKRQTSFAAVHVRPAALVSDARPAAADLVVDTFRASGAGGQHVNRTESAVRITHRPTGTSVVCQSSRSQHRNRALALSLLHARLADQQRAVQAADSSERRQAAGAAGFGAAAIRSYVLHPYRQVKDARSGLAVTDIDAVLAGGLDPFLMAALLPPPNEP
jgi:peptide chain release factor 2